MPISFSFPFNANPFNASHAAPISTHLIKSGLLSSVMLAQLPSQALASGAEGLEATTPLPDRSRSAYSDRHRSTKIQQEDETTIVITAGRIAQPLSDVNSATAVLTREDIEQKQFSTLSEALNAIPGITINNRGGQGKQTSVFLRGASANQLLVLVDGVRAGSATLGSFAFEQYSMDSIERIEVVRGPSSSLYGSDAIGGVIQIFTRGFDAKGGQEPQAEFNASIGGEGKYGTNQTALSTQIIDRGFSISANIERVDTEGFDASTFADSDKDGFTSVSKNARFSIGQSPANQFSLSWVRSDAENEFDSTFGGDISDTEQRTINAQYQLAFTDQFKTHWSIGQHEDISNTFNRSTLPENQGARENESIFETQRDSVSIINTLQIQQDHQFTFGADYYEDRVDGTTDYQNSVTGKAVTSRYNRALFFSQRSHWNILTLEVSGRGDENEQYGHQNTGSIRLSAQLSPKVSGTISRGTAFKAPTFNDLYFPFSGNSLLNPQTSGTTEVGFRFQPSSNTQLDSYLFKTRISNLIQWEPDNETGFWSPNNISTEIAGWESSFQSRLDGGFLFSGQITILDPKISDGSNFNDNLLPLRSRRSLYLDASRQWHQWGAGINITANSEQYSDSANLISVPGYALLGARVSYRPIPSLQFEGKLDNLTDKEYQTSPGYNQPGRTVLFTVHFTIE